MSEESVDAPPLQRPSCRRQQMRTRGGRWYRAAVPSLMPPPTQGGGRPGAREWQGREWLPNAASGRIRSRCGGGGSMDCDRRNV